MNFNWKLVIAVAAVLLSATVLAAPGHSPAAAQGFPGGNCPEVVAQALDSIDTLCTGLGRNESCYGFNRVDALFWEDNPALVFENPADRVPLMELRQIATAPLNLDTGLWGVAAMQLHSPDLPEILPGQAVMFLLMGDTMLESRVNPEDAAAPVEPVQVVTQRESDLMTLPSSAANSLGTLPAGTHIQVVGLDESGEWAELLLTEGGHGWLPVEHIIDPGGALQQLPVTYGPNVPPRYGPMQSFYFSTGFAGPSCNEAPDALVVQSPEGIEVAFNINNMDVRIGSTVAFTTVEAPDGSGRRVLIGVLFEGHMTLTINGRTITLTEPGQTFAITLNEDGLVDENSQFMRMTADPLGDWVANACQNALQSGMFSRTDVAASCGAELTYYTDQGFLTALGLPTRLPPLGAPQNNPLPPAPPPVPIVPQPPFQWPQITRPTSGTTLVGDVHHMTVWTATPGAASYRLDIFPDSTNLEGTLVNFSTTNTQFDVPLVQMPSRPDPGWGYFMRVVPLDASGAPMANAAEAPLTWVLRLSPEPTAPPPPPAKEPVCYELCEGDFCWQECCVEVCEGGECWQECTSDFPSDIPQ